MTDELRAGGAASVAAAAVISDPCVVAFASRWRGPRGTDLAALAPRLTALGEAARAAHPGIAVDEARLMAAIGEHAPADPEQLAGYLARCRADELWLTQAAGDGDAQAIAAIERVHAATIAAVCRRFASAALGIDDLHQILRGRLYVPEPGRRPRIAEYAGQGFLDNWLRVTAVRVFLDLGKRKDRAREELPGDDPLFAMASPEEIELSLIKVEYRAAVAEALREAVRLLEPGDRHLLRQHLVAELSIDQLGAALGIHRTTVARRIARAREQLAADTRRALVARHRLSEAELDEMLALVISGLDVSLSKLLASESETQPPSLA
jgi:RNA polymerase sigma-70 factor (ECF subfamily)